MAGIRKGTHDISPKIRAAFVRAVGRKGGDDYLATLIGKSMEDDFLATLNAISKFTVRENSITGKVEHEHKHTVVQAETQRIIDCLTEEGTGTSPEISVQDGSVLPDTLHIPAH